MRIQAEVQVPRGVPVKRAFVTVAARRRVAVAERLALNLRADTRRNTSPTEHRSFRVIPDKR